MFKKSNTSTLLKLFGFAMIPLFLSFILLVFSCNTVEKSVSIELKTDSVLFVGLNNPIKIAATGYELDELTVSFEKGTIKKTEYGYIVMPVEKGVATITVSLDEKEILSKQYPVHLIPSPIALPISQEEVMDVYEMSIVSLVEEKGIKAILPDYVLVVEFKVVSFNLEVTGNGGITLIERSESDEFTENQLDLIRRCRPGQELIIEEIKAIGPDGMTRDLDAISILVE